MKKKVMIIVVLQLLVIFTTAIVVKDVVKREVMLKNLIDGVTTELIDCDNFYERNKDKDDVDYREINSSYKHLASAVGSYECTGTMTITPNTAKIIDSMHRIFYITAYSNIISKENAQAYYNKIGEIILVLNKIDKNAYFKDISNEEYKEINDILESMEKMYHQH